MSNRELVIDIVKKLPANASLKDIVEKINFIAAVKEGLEQSEREEGVTIEEARRLLRSWTTKSS